MKFKAIVMLCRLLIVSLFCLSVQSAYAGMIGTNQVISTASAQADRAHVLNVMGRAEVSSQLQSMGIDPQAAKDRVAAMTDQEVHSLAGQLETLPAGANGGDWGWGLAAVIVIAAVIYYFWGYRNR